MKVSRILGVAGFALAFGLTATACGSVEPPYTGQATVVDKEVDIEKKKKKVNGKTKTTTKTEYEIMLDVDNSTVDLEVDVTKVKYDSLQKGQKVQVVNGKIQ